MVKDILKNFKKLITKYLILLLVYIGLLRFVMPYSLKLYYTVVKEPMGSTKFIDFFDSFIGLITLLINLAFVIFMLIDAKKKSLIDWLIILITLFSPEVGIALFIVWLIYIDLSKKYEAQQGI